MPRHICPQGIFMPRYSCPTLGTSVPPGGGGGGGGGVGGNWCLG